MSGQGGFPIPVSRLAEIVPHRPPMVWVDEVSWVNATEGECRVRLDPGALYRGRRGLRSTSIIEWIAQSYAYVRAAQAISGTPGAPTAPPQVVYLAAVRDAKLGALVGKQPVEIRVLVRSNRSFGPLALVEGQVMDGCGNLLGSASLKVYAE